RRGGVACAPRGRAGAAPADARATTRGRGARPSAPARRRPRRRGRRTAPRDRGWFDSRLLPLLLPHLRGRGLLRAALEALDRRPVDHYLDLGGDLDGDRLLREPGHPAVDPGRHHDLVVALERRYQLFVIAPPLLLGPHQANVEHARE